MRRVFASAVIVFLMGTVFPIFAMPPVADFADGTWVRVGQDEVNIANGIVWSVQRHYRHSADMGVTGVEFFLPWDSENSVYRIWGNVLLHYQSIRIIGKGWTRPVRGGDLEFTLQPDETTGHVASLVLMIYEDGQVGKRPTAWGVYPNPLAEVMSPPGAGFVP
ncbi:MAG: hypothetical protein HYT41_02315 [Candidatus Sungbacteria bacterium]|nr:hypothetical protein [Candidatus Sungbacteria bacterium]